MKRYIFILSCCAIWFFILIPLIKEDYKDDLNKEFINLILSNQKMIINRLDSIQSQEEEVILSIESDMLDISGDTPKYIEYD